MGTVDRPVANSPYDAGFFQQQQSISFSSAREIVPYVLDLLPIRSVCDVGCGVGTWLAVFRERGIEDLLGIDGGYVARDRLKIPAENFLPADLSGDWAPERRFDLALSVEVAEHLPEASAGSFVRGLTRLSDLVLFSAALPMQGGTQHLNEQWPSYWIKLFAERGFEPIDCLRPRFWSNRNVDLCYRNNMLLFAAAPALERFPRLRELSARSAGNVADIVHPERYEMLVRHSAKDRIHLSLALRMLPILAYRSVMKRLRPRGAGGPIRHG